MPAMLYATGFIPNYWGWTSYTPVIPKLYWDIYSQEERIKRLCMEYDKLTHYSSMLAQAINDIYGNVEETIADFSKKIQAQIDAQNEAITKQLTEQDAKVTQQLAEMKEYIDRKFAEFAEGTQVYDVTTGTYRPSKQAMRRLYQALAYGFKGESALVSEVAKMTVAELANKTVYETAWGNFPTIIIDDQKGVDIN